MNDDNVMRKVKLAKITLNIGAGKNEEALRKGVILLKMITGVDPIKTETRKRIPSWGLRPGLQIGAKITLRGKQAEEVLGRLLAAKENELSPKSFDNEGNVSFGIAEYIEIPGLEYNPDIKIIGLEVAVTLERPGFRVKRRKISRKTLPQKQRISSQEAAGFLKEKYNIKVEA